MRRLAIAVALLVTALPWQPAVALLPKDALAIEQALADLGLPAGAIDGVWDKDTGRATCIWRELTGRAVLRSWPVVGERPAIKVTTALQIPRKFRVGININVQCQSAVWIDEEVVVSETTVTDQVTGQPTPRVSVRFEKSIRRIMPVSTGMAAFPTSVGVFHVGWRVDRWWQSTIYSDGLMYRPLFFHDGMALHGSSSDALVKWYPASHGCVRMLHADIDALWDGGFHNGSTVYVYGKWHG